MKEINRQCGKKCVARQGGDSPRSEMSAGIRWEPNVHDSKPNAVSSSYNYLLMYRCLQLKCICSEKY